MRLGEQLEGPEEGPLANIVGATEAAAVASWDLVSGDLGTMTPSYRGRTAQARYEKSENDDGNDGDGDDDDGDDDDDDGGDAHRRGLTATAAWISAAPAAAPSISRLGVGIVCVSVCLTGAKDAEIAGMARTLRWLAS